LAGIFILSNEAIDVVAHHFSDGIYAKQMTLAKGYIAISHIHKYSHLSILASGDVIVNCDGIKQEYSAPACIEIKAGVVHEIQALSDVVWYCIHKVDGEYNEQNIDETLIQRN